MPKLVKSNPRKAARRSLRDLQAAAPLSSEAGGLQPLRSAQITKVPQQARSRERVEQLLNAARKLVSKTGPMALTMSSVAELAGVPIGSLYQYFPTKPALLYRLFEARLEEFRAEMRRQLQAVSSPHDFSRRMREILIALYEENRADPFMRALWGGVQASPETRELLAADNTFYSQLFYETARRVGSTVPPKQLRIRATVINDMWDSAIRTAITMEDPTGVDLIKESLDIGLRAFFSPN